MAESWLSGSSSARKTQFERMPPTSKERRLAEMYNNPRYADCRIRVGPADAEQTFHSNRTLLARCSEVFGKMLFEQEMQEEREAEVHIADCSGAAFQELLRCSYDLDPEIHEDNFVEVYQLARKYDVEELLEAVREWMRLAATRPTNALRALNAAESLSGSTVEEEVAGMLEECIKTVNANCESLLDDEAFFVCSASTLERLLQQDSLLCDEEHLWLSLLRWKQWQSEELGCDPQLRGLAKFVRFNLMSAEFFVDKVVPAAVLDDRDVVELLGARATGRSASSFPDADVPRCGIVGATWKCTRNITEAFEVSNMGCTVQRNNYPHWKRALGRWNCDDKMQRGLLARCNATFSVRIDHIQTQKARYAGDILVGVARPDITPDDHSETRNNTVAAWVFSCRDGTFISPHATSPVRLQPCTDGDVLRFELRAGTVFVSRNGGNLTEAFEDVTGPVVPVVEMNLAGSKVTLC